MPIFEPTSPPAPPPPACPSLMDLASYLDGRLPLPEAAAIRLHMTTCEACMQTMSDFRQLHGEENPQMVIAPPHVQTRAMALISGDAVAKNDEAARGSSRWVFARRAAAVAASIVIGAGGYYIGVDLSSPGHAVAANDDEGDVFFGLLDDPADDSLDSDFFFSFAMPEGTSS